MADRVKTFASFALFNYRLFWLGALVSNVGGWMARVAQDWLVLTKLTDHSAQALGIITALQFLPIPLISPMAGALADRFSKRKLLILTQSALGVTAFGLWILVATGMVQLWHAFLFAFLQGIAAAFDMPVRQAFVSEMVPEKFVPNAIGLNSAQFNGARLLGPGLAGLLIGCRRHRPCTAHQCHQLHRGDRSPVVHAPPSNSWPRPKRTGSGTVREGVAYVRNRPDILLILGIIFVFSTFGMNFQITNALMATEVFGKGASEYGMLGSIMAIGTLAAAFIAARRARPRLRVLLLGVLGFALFTTGAALATSYVMFAVMLVGVGLCALTVMTSCNATVQLASAPAFRGRVMAVYMAVNMGGTPIGSPIIGWIGDHWGARWTLGIGAIATFAMFLVTSIYVMVHDGVRVRLSPAWPPRLLVNHRLVEEVEASAAVIDPDPRARVA